jgi:hypothetical protein
MQLSGESGNTPHFFTLPIIFLVAYCAILI